jgi:hypothetical protein
MTPAGPFRPACSLKKIHICIIHNAVGWYGLITCLPVFMNINAIYNKKTLLLLQRITTKSASMIWTAYCISLDFIPDRTQCSDTWEEVL